RTGYRVAYLRNPHHPGLADRAAKVEHLAIGVGVGEVRVGLPGKEPAQRAIGISETQFQVIPDMRQGWAVKTRTARKVPFEESPRLAPGSRRARLDVE